MSRVFTTVFCVLALSLSAFAVELDKKQARGLERANKALTKTEGKIGQFEGEKRYTDQAGISLGRALAGAKKKLDRLPADGEGVAEALKRVTAGEARVAALVQAKGSLGAKSGLDAKSAKTINYIANTLQNLANELGREGALSDRNKGRFERQVSEAKESLGKFAAENHVVKGLLAKAAQIEARLGGLKDSLAADQKSAAETSARLQGMIADPSYAKDSKRIEALEKAFREDWIWDLTARYLKTGYNTSSYDEALEAARQWGARKKEWDAYKVKYAELVKSGIRGSTGVWALKSDRRINEYGAAIAIFLASGPSQVLSNAGRARELARAAVAKKDHQAFSRFNGEIRGSQTFTTRVAEILLALRGPDHRAVGKSLALELAQEEEKLAEVIVAGNRAPKDAYTGDDTTALRSFVVEQWTKNFPEDKVLAVRFPSESLQRTVAWRWDASRKQHYKVDQSQMWIRVIVERGEEAVIYRALVRRLHLMKDKLVLRWQRPKHPSPSSRMLTKNMD